MPFNINSLDRNCPYRRKFDWSVKNDYSAHDTQSAALGFDFQENPSLFRKPVISLPANLPAPEIKPAPAPWVWDPVLFSRRARAALNPPPTK